mgnify:FL=1
MTLPFIVDSHCHLDFPDFDGERDALIARAAENGVRLMVTISTRVERLPVLLDIVDTYSNVYATVGTHPNSAADEPDVPTDRLVTLSAHKKIVGIGEAGLDYHYDKAGPAVQEAVFRRHIDGARETGLPLVIHARDADADMERILAEEMARGAFPFLLHCFSSGPRLAEAGLDMGGYISFSGILTFNRSEDIRAVAAASPMDRILVETDAPFLAPPPFRGKRNEPAYVAHTARVGAKLYGMTLPEFAALTSANFNRLFPKAVA